MDDIISGVVVVIVIGTTIWVGFDSAERMKDIPKEARKQIVAGVTSPASWVAGCLLLWVVAFPLYLIYRSKYRSFSESQYKASGPRQCSACSKFYEGDPSFCPNCGAKLKEV